MNHKVTKAIIPVAGRGTRFLPATKEISKEIIPIINTPMIYYVVKEAVDSGVEKLIFITSSGKEEILDYFDKNLSLEYFLKENNKEEYLNLLDKISSMIEIISIRQKEQLGLGHAINMAASVVSADEYFAVLLGDEILLNKQTPVLQQLINISHQHQGSVIAGMQVPKQETNKYGIISGDQIEGHPSVLKMSEMVEKPDPQVAPTNLATPGRYVLSGKIFSYLDQIPRGVGGEYQLTDAINLMCQHENVFAYEFEGERFDTGNVFGYLDATIEFALRDPKYTDFMKNLLKEKIAKYE